MTKVKWQVNGRLVGTRRVYARTTRSEIIVRIENDGDTTKFAEWAMPKFIGLEGAIDQTNLQVKDEDIKA